MAGISFVEIDIKKKSHWMLSGHPTSPLKAPRHAAVEREAIKLLVCEDANNNYTKLEHARMLTVTVR